MQNINSIHIVHATLVYATILNFIAQILKFQKATGRIEFALK